MPRRPKRSAPTTPTRAPAPAPIDPPCTPLQVACLAALLLVTHLYFANDFRAFPNPNVRSRLYLTLAIVDHGSLHIDDCVRRFGRTMDMAEFARPVDGGRTERHFYTDKAPGYSILLVPIAWILRHTVVAYDDIHTMSLLLRVFGLSLPAVAFWLLTWRHWSRLAGGQRRGMAIVLAGALGTNFFVYATQLFAHAAAAMLLFAAYRVFMRPGGLGRMAVGGALLAIAFTIDYMVLPALIIVPLAAILERPGRRVAAAAVLIFAALPIAIAWMAYNRACFGNPLDVGFRHHIDPTYGPAYQRGIWGIQPPNPAAILGMTLLPSRGIFWLSPFLLLAPLGWRRLRRELEHRRQANTAIAIVVGIALFAMTTVDWRGGWSLSIRYLVPAIPFMLEGVAAALNIASAAAFFCATAIIGIVQTALAAATFPDTPNEFWDPYYDMAINLLRGGHVNGTLLRSDARPAELIPFAILTIFAIRWLLRLVRPRAPGPPRHRAIPVLAAIAAIGIQTAVCWRLDYLRTHVLADVIGKMGYTCDADALRIRLHEDAIQGPRVRLYDLTQLALIRAASACDDLRNPAQAIELAERAVRGARGADAASAYDALAAAQAAAGRFDDAQASARQAVSLAEKPSDRSQMAARMQLYAMHRPYRRSMSPR